MVDYDGIIELELSSLCNAKCSDCMRTRLDNANKFYEKKNLINMNRESPQEYKNKVMRCAW